MRTEYRIIATALFDTAAERDKAYEALKTFLSGTVSKNAVFKRADMSKDEYAVPDNAILREKVL